MGTTTTITTLDRATLKAISEAMATALKTVEADLGIAVKVGRCTFSASNAAFKVEVAVKGEGGLKSRAGRFPILARRDDGKVFKFVSALLAKGASRG